MTTTLTAADALSKSERRTLEAIFRHPAAHNLEWREVVALIGAIGSVEERRNDEVVFVVSGQRLHTREPHAKDLSAQDVSALGHFLMRAGWSASPPAAAGDAAPGLVVVIDHAEARVYHIDVDAKGAARHAIAHWGEHHFLHPLAQKDHRLEDQRLGAADYAFFEEIAAALADGGRIVVIGHGKGESNMAAQLGVYLKAHHNETFRRIVRTVAADIPNRTTPELLALGAEALAA